jgi:hypothetical protein
MTAWAIGRQRATRWVTMVALGAGATVLSVASPPASAKGTSAGGLAPDTFKLSGAVSGTLHDGPDAGCPYGGIDNHGFVELNDLVGSVTGLKGVASWGIDINVKKNGTFSFPSSLIHDPNAELNVALKNGSISQGVGDNFFAYGGTVTIKGETGSIAATMKQVDGKTVQLVGRWACGAPAAAATVAGAGWKLATLVASTKEGSGPADFTSVSCPSATFCAAVDQTGDAFVLSGTAWSKGDAIDSTAQSNSNDELGSVSCASSTFCVAGDDQDDVYVYNGSNWSAADQLDSSTTSPSVSFSVSCPTASFCLAVDGNGNYFTYSGTSWSAAQTINANLSLVIGEVSCASSTFCEAAFGSKTTTYDGSSWSTPQSLSTPAAGQSGSTPSIDGISCPSSTFCAGAGALSSNKGYLDTFNGTSWAKPLILTTNLGPQSFATVSCPTISFCMAPGLDGWVTYNGSTWSSPHAFLNQGGPVGTGPLYANSISCPSSKFCEEVESNGYADSFRQ